VRAAVAELVQAALEAEMTEAIGAAKSERREIRLSYRSGYYSRSLITRVGTLELRVPQDRDRAVCALSALGQAVSRHLG
jgi:transposase-like protein